MNDTPEGPIFVLEQDDAFLNVAPTVDAALRHRHHEGEMGDPPAGALEFFDVNGRKYRLELVEGDAGDHRRQVRRRVGAMLTRLKDDVVDAFGDYPHRDRFDIADTVSDFEQFAHEAVKIFDDGELPAPSKEPPPNFRPEHTGDWWHNARHRMGWSH